MSITQETPSISDTKRLGNRKEKKTGLLLCCTREVVLFVCLFKIWLLVCMLHFISSSKIYDDQFMTPEGGGGGAKGVWNGGW